MEAVQGEFDYAIARGDYDEDMTVRLRKQIDEILDGRF
jgi:hypothetical protein